MEDILEFCHRLGVLLRERETHRQRRKVKLNVAKKASRFQRHGI